MQTDYLRYCRVSDAGTLGYYLADRHLAVAKAALPVKLSGMRREHLPQRSMGQLASLGPTNFSLEQGRICIALQNRPGLCHLYWIAALSISGSLGIYPCVICTSHHPCPGTLS